MAIVQNPVTGRSKNAFANAIFTTVLGQNVMRSKPLQVANPRTLPQRQARAKLAYLSEQAKKLKNALEIGFKKAASGMYPRNMYSSENYQTLSIDNDLIITQGLAGVKIAKGSLGDAPVIDSATCDNAGNIEIDYFTDNQNYPSTVKTCLAVIKSNGRVAGVSTNAGTYSTLTAAATIEGAQVGDTVYIFAYDTVTLEVTNSQSATLT